MNILNELEYFIFKSTQLRWNRFKNKKYSTIYCFCFTVKIDSPLFTSKQFSEEYNSRFDLILELDRRGYSTVQIRDFLNTNRIRPFRTDLFSTKLVWTTLKKRKERKKFRETFVRKISEVTVVVYSLKEP